MVGAVVGDMVVAVGLEVTGKVVTGPGVLGASLGLLVGGTTTTVGVSVVGR